MNKTKNNTHIATKTPSAQSHPGAHLITLRPNAHKHSSRTRPDSFASLARSHARHEQRTKPKPMAPKGVDCVDYSPQSPIYFQSIHFTKVAVWKYVLSDHNLQICIAYKRQRKQETRNMKERSDNINTKLNKRDADNMNKERNRRHDTQQQE